MRHEKYPANGYLLFAFNAYPKIRVVQFGQCYFQVLQLSLCLSQRSIINRLIIIKGFHNSAKRRQMDVLDLIYG